jgi:glutathione S-transferase
VLWESNAIMQYLASVRPGPLWPNDARALADISRWQCWQLTHWNEGTAKLIFQRVLKEGYRNVRAWYARIDALPAWQESRPRM